MMDAVRGWLLSVIGAAFLTAAAESLVPAGTMRRVASLVGGLVLLLALTRPLLGTDWKRLKVDFDGYARQIDRRQEELQRQSNAALAELIASRTAAYISDKAGQLGVECRVRVVTEPGPEGTPVPAGAELTCPPSQALADYMEQELEIPKERQVWNGTE